ncbi:MAG: sugar nucleotide-binding protein [Planctomycetaceae bacterium]|nr:sugar nucleotide-binding protein [Planctomycetaceae bacterium]
MDKLFIVGIDTMLGANLAVSCREQFEVHGATCAAGHAPAGFSVTAVGDASAARTKALLAEVRPNWVILAGQLARSSWEDSAAAILWQQEVALASAFGAAAREAGVATCLLSTDAVFAGPRLFHEENARATAATAAAVAARESEIALVASCALVVRTHAYGWRPNGGGLIDTLWDQLPALDRPAGEGRHYATPILASDLAPLLMRAYERKLRGLYHITGAERTNRIRFANELASAAGYDALDRSPLLQSEVQSTVAVETSLNTRRARRDLELPMPLLREGLERLVAQRVNGYLDRLQPARSKKTSQAA